MVTLPGAPLVWQGEELGLVAGHEPACRGPMDWDLAARRTPELRVEAWTEGKVPLQVFPIEGFYPLTEASVALK